MKALLMVDLQNDFLPGGALPVAEGDNIIPLINDVQGDYDFVIASKDWHPVDHVSFAVNHCDRKPGQFVELPYGSQILWPEHCVQGTKGADFATGLTMDNVVKVFNKGVDPMVDSYSSFFDNNRSRVTGLAEFLRSMDVKQLFVCGLATDYCVKFTVLDALDIGFDTTVLVDLCRGVNVNPGDVDKAIEDMVAAGCKLS